MKENYSLKQRLDHLKTLSQERSPGKDQPRDNKIKPTGFLKDWEPLGKYTWRRTSIFPNPLPEKVYIPGEYLKCGCLSSSLVFIDTETTGLSGGAGTMIFLFGAGYARGRDFILKQFFLSDYPGEAEFLSLIKNEIFNPEAICVSYNGRAFDIPILRSRFILTRQEPPPFNNLDLLYPARLFWRGVLDSCSLKSLEEEFGIVREKDLPGFLIPSTYFSYLQNRDTKEMEIVFFHHQQDILSLAYVATRITEIILQPDKSWRINRRALGRLFLSEGISEGTGMLEEEAHRGDLESARILGTHLKRAGQWQEALSLWKKLWEKGSVIYSGVEMAKYYEHSARDYGKALDITLCILERINKMPGNDFIRKLKGELQTRAERLRRKAERNSRS